MEISFIYQAPGRDEKQYDLFNWKEVGHYIQGIDVVTRSFKTFLKSRVLSYLNDGESMLDRPFSEPPPRVDKAAKHGPEILFTGFKAADREELEWKAIEVGMKVCQSVTKGLNYLCVGYNAGPTKVCAAREKHVYIISQSQFMNLIETGELPDEIDEEYPQVPCAPKK